MFGCLVCRSWWRSWCEWVGSWCVMGEGGTRVMVHPLVDLLLAWSRVVARLRECPRVLNGMSSWETGREEGGGGRGGAFVLSHSTAVG